ncbi:MAG: D-alanyl-D-alanine carboxypeptidase/D-alanyl-D-alanine-endopeptidase [Deltaproteobacteria bacterium]|nr:D-alanyl-D-alanine carboxypeptidase/D-alanyl-D-alanine-endopeptidase [Deltaproteobacteria bacterium]MBI2342496.1 D-alanyl-D-alanine carboxypeptidase/D-alanyl-D-alanine-endopeptidase [Deltaproteobacteria bacterium]
MKNAINKLTIVLFVTIGAFANAAPVDESIRGIIRDSKLRNAEYGIYAVSFPGNKALAEINKDLPLNPASCMKLITTAAALRTLGADYRFPTKFYLSADGDLWVKGFGDPSLVIEKLGEMADNLIKSGLPVTIGDIYIDDSYFDRGGYPGRRANDSNPYNAVTSAVALNHAALSLEVSPASIIGMPAIISLDAPGMNVQNLAKTGQKRSTRTIRIMRTGDTVKVTGRIPLNSRIVQQFFSVQEPSLHFGNALKALLVESGINVTGHVKQGAVPQSARFLLESKSIPLSEIIKDMNKNSNNFMAEQVTKAIGAKSFGAPGTTEKGVAESSKYLKSLGGSNFYMENGSGLSYKTNLSANDIIAVMKDMYNDAELRDIYLSSLSVAGIDGTTKKWDSPILDGKLRAKTGSLRRVSTLAGFLPNKDEMILFAVMLNGGRVDFTTGRRVTKMVAEDLAANK